MPLTTQPGARPRPRPTVILLHSSASSARQWQSLAETLQPGFRVLAIDLHGHGARPGWAGATPLTLADEAALVRPLLEEAGGAHLVGHSYGAAVALKAATLHPDLVHSLVAYEPVLLRLLRDDAASRQQAQEFLAVGESIHDRLLHGDAAAAARLFIDFWSAAGTWDAMPAARQQAVAGCMPAVLGQFEALSGEACPRARLARLGMPMLLLSGARTVAATRRIAELLRTALPTARHEVLPDMGHLGPIMHPAPVNARIARFLGAGAAPVGRVEAESLRDSHRQREASPA